MILFEFDGRRAFIVGRARVPEGASVHSAVLDRSDLLMRLDALSDDTRLRIVEMATRDGTITTQMVMDELELSQSSASRHLTQLAATGILSVDGSERTKRYRTNPRRIDDLCHGLRQLVRRRSRTGGRV
jgi:DNA-binding transcriptional ArsR family regulator